MIVNSDGQIQPLPSDHVSCSGDLSLEETRWIGRRVDEPRIPWTWDMTLSLAVGVLIMLLAAGGVGWFIYEVLR